MSFAIIRRETGEVVAEVFTSRAAAAINRDRFHVLPIGVYLGTLNRLIREAGGVQPAPDVMADAFNGADA